MLTSVVVALTLAAAPQPTPQQTVLDYVDEKGEFKPQRVQLAHAGAWERKSLYAAIHAVLKNPRAVEAVKKKLLPRFLDPEKKDRWREANVLSKLGSKEILPALIAAAKAGEGWAIADLGLYGELPWREGVWMPRYTAVFAPAPDPSATQALLTLADTASKENRYHVLKALETHTGPKVDALFSKLLDDPEEADRALSAALHTGRELPFEKLVALLDSKREDQPRLAAWVLGQTGRKEAIEPLLAHYSANPNGCGKALRELAGLERWPKELENKEPAVEQAWWKAYFGPKLEKFDPARAIRFEKLAPGMY